MTIQAMAGGSAIPFATVQAYTFPQMQPIGAAVQTDANGKYTITGLPLDQAYIIIATKQIDGKSIRLSTYVEVYGEETTADIDVTSSLVVEYVRTMVDTDPTFVVDQFDFDAIREAVEANMELDNISMFVGEGTFLLDGGISEDVMDLSRPHFFAFDGCMA